MEQFKKATGTTGTGTHYLLIIHLKLSESMRYNISTFTSPKKPNLGKGTECIKLLLSQVSEDMLNPSFLCFSLFLAHVCGSEFRQTHLLKYPFTP